MNKQTYSINNCKLLTLSSIIDSRGSLCVLEGNTVLPFPIQRVYYLYGCSLEHLRGGHAHINLKQVFIALNGTINIKLDDGKNSKDILLDKPNLALYVSPHIWRDIRFLSKDAVLLVLASDLYYEADYIRSYNDFKLFTSSK